MPRFLVLPIVVLLAMAPRVQAERWKAWLECPGGELPFELHLGDATATIVNGEETIEVPIARDQATPGELVMSFPHYDAEVRATLDARATAYLGEWTKVGRDGKVSRLPFRAVKGIARRFKPTMTPVTPKRFGGRWLVDFASSDDPAIAIFEQEETGRVLGTFLTTTGDYRYLEGVADGPTLKLSCFDGAHAFLFHATMNLDGTLSGDFWSRDSWHETWTAVRDPDARLPDAFGQTAWVGEQDLSRLVFQSVDGQPTTVASLHEPGQPMLLEVFGTWCPNCHDASAYLGELTERYGDRISVVGLAFEHTDDPARSARQVRRYAELHSIEYPLLIAGHSHKGRASEAMPVLDRVRSYPTTIFVDGDGRVRGVYTGFSGPATGEAHARLRESWERLIDEMLGE